MTEQEALETALVNAIRDLGYTPAQCARTPKGMPEPRAGQVFVSVWSPGKIESKSKTCLDLTFYVYVTLTLRLTLPWDRWIEHYDDIGERVKAIICLGHGDIYNYAICNAANALAGYRSSGSPDGTHPVGFCEALWFQGADDNQIEGPDWFHASVDSKSVDVGISQTMRFGGARRIQRLSQMS